MSRPGKLSEEQLRQVAQKFSLLNVRIESMVVVGKPFAEILRIAADLHFSLIVMGIRGRHQGGIEEILFGSTAEKVLRAARIPVVCVPPETNKGTERWRITGYRMNRLRRACGATGRTPYPKVRPLR